MSIYNFLDWYVSVLYFRTDIAMISRLMQQFDDFIRLFSVDRMLLALFCFPRNVPAKPISKHSAQNVPPQAIMSSLMQCSNLTKIYQIMYFQVTEDNRTLLTLFLSAIHEMLPKKCPCKTHFKTQCIKMPLPQPYCQI
jgi:hypothetical protein